MTTHDAPTTPSTPAGHSRPRLPWWLKYANRIVAPLNRLGVVIGTQHVLSVPGRRSGVLRSTPVSLLTVEGQRYICSIPGTQWARNARAAGWGLLARGRRQERVALVELPTEARGPVLRAFPRQVPHGVQFFVKVGAVQRTADPEAFAAAASLMTVFRVDPLPASAPTIDPVQ